MAYQALYRKWRPVKFDDIIGQDHITGTVKNEIVSGKIAHAYLFTGTRGTGKTTTAKILSRALNCQSPIDGNPCNECETCKSIMDEVCLDVQEIDAASNTGVENIRDIISQVQYLPTMGKYKVFIIDEVHMLSKGAFNALLKTLEEPPAHVVFILATTEVQQIPATILSRCQRFDFKNISIEDIVKNLASILKSEGIEAQTEALEYVAYLGDGSMRDSLSILDRCLAFSTDNLTLDSIVEVVGTVDDKVLYDFAKDIAQNDTFSALKRFGTCIDEGKNLDNIVKGLLGVFREIIMYKINPESFSASRIKTEYLKGCADLFDIPSLSNHINTLSQCMASFKTFASPRVMCECVLIRLTTPEMNTDYSSVLARLSAVENKIASGVLPVAPVHIESSSKEKPSTEKSIEKNAQTKTEPASGKDESNDTKAEKAQAKSFPSDGGAGKVIANWADVTSYLMTKGKLTLYTLLFEAKVYEQDSKVCIRIDDGDKRHTVSEKTNLDLLKEAIEASTGVNPELKIVSESSIDVQNDDDIFKSLDNLGKSFPQNFNID